MKYSIPASLVLILLIYLSAQAQDRNLSLSEIITVDKTEQIITRLSSDEMRGRRAFTPGVEKAARYISNRFEEIGLEYLEGANSYRQNFTLYQLQPQNEKLTLNGNEIASGNYFAVSRQALVSWTDLTASEIRTITKSDSFPRMFSQFNQSEQDLVVLVDSDHKNIFARYADYFKGGSRGFGLDEGSTKLFILTDAGQLQSGSFTLNQDVNKLQGYNVVGKITGSEHPEEFVLFSAHYDHIGIIEPVEGDSIANGADDDASGTTAVIELAEYFKTLGPQARTTVFVAFTAEEMGGYGSQYFSRQMDPEQVVAMFNIEMIGKPSKFGPNTAYMTGFEMTDMGKILQQSLKDTPYRIFPDPYPEQNLFFRSDNATLARQGVPAHSISSVQIKKDSLYHTVNDEMESLNLEHLTNMIRAIALSSRTIVSGEATPSRIDPELLN